MFTDFTFPLPLRTASPPLENQPKIFSLQSQGQNATMTPISRICRVILPQILGGGRCRACTKAKQGRGDLPSRSWKKLNYKCEVGEWRRTKREKIRSFAGGEFKWISQPLFPFHLLDRFEADCILINTFFPPLVNEKRPPLSSDASRRSRKRKFCD